MEIVQSKNRPTVSTTQTPKYKKILELIGNTPIAKLELDTPCTLLAKLDYLNPGGSVKDRTALYMIEEAQRTGQLKPGGTIIEASSGNQGIALAMIGVIKGYKVIITVPERTSSEKVATLRAYGAEVIVCRDINGTEGVSNYHTKAEELLKTIPDAFMPNQYFNIANVHAHYNSTGPEIWQQTAGTVTHAIFAMGSCGTISGAGRYLKEKNPNIKIIGVDSVHSKLSSPTPKAYRSEGIGVDVISDTLDRSAIDQIFTIEDDDAFNTAKDLAKKHGLLVGISSGAVMHIALQYAKQLKKEDVLVVMLADSGRAYLSKIFGL